MIALAAVEAFIALHVLGAYLVECRRQRRRLGPVEWLRPAPAAADVQSAEAGARAPKGA